MSIVGALVAARAVPRVAAYGMLPRWDLAGHLDDGWTAYYHLAQAQLGQFAWTLWSQGYWPPGQALFQLPFFIALGGDVTAGLFSSVVAFVLTGLGMAWLVRHIAGPSAWLSTVLAVVAMATSPFMLGYASVAMSEMLGALAQVVVLVCYARTARAPTAADGRWLALSLTALFFTKYNYFVLLAVPLACHEFLSHRRGRNVRERLRVLGRAAAAVVATPVGTLFTAYLLVVTAVLASGGVSFSIGEQSVAFRTIGYAAHPVIYAGLFLAWRRFRRGDARSRLNAIDPRLGPLVLWFGIPVALWLASPYPNHVKDVATLLVNIPLGPPTAGLGLASYLHALRDVYFLHPASFALAATAFGVALARYRTQPPLMRLLLVVVTLQGAMIAAHHTRDPRFLLVSMPIFWVVAACEIGRWAAAWRPAGVAIVSGGAAVAGLIGAGAALESDAFQRIAVEHYVESPELADAFATVRVSSGREGRIAVLGRRDSVSPGLVRWQLGPAAGQAHAPANVVRVADTPLIDEADTVVIVEPSDVPIEVGVTRVATLVAHGRLGPPTRVAITNLGTTLSLYRRPQGRGPHGPR
ncbi:MAG: hypothetical protein AB7U83_01420 [Vicinamibacterales bacterium]